MLIEGIGNRCQALSDPDSLARSGASPLVPEAAGVVSAVVTREEAGEGAPAPSPCVSEGTTSAQRILRTVPLKAVPCAHARAGCNYPEGDCAELCLPGGVRP